MAGSDYLSNHFLIAMPSLADPNFYRSVTYLCEHTDEGAVGLIINRTVDMRLGDLLSQVDIDATDARIAQMPVYVGGPVETDRGFVLHRPVGDWDSTLRVTDEIGLTTSRDILAAMAAGEGPRDAIVALGYAGWGAGQLERELTDNAWLSGPADSAVLFDTPSEERWQAAASRLGVDLSLLSGDAGHA